jgi:hypothetical protein
VHHVSIIHPPLGTARYRFVFKIGAWIDTEQHPMAYIFLPALVTNWVRALPAKLQFTQFTKGVTVYGD